MKEFSRNKLLILFDRQDGLCAYCKAKLVDDCKRQKTPHVDHVNPKANGGGSELENLCLACSYCNSAKKDRNEEEFREWLRPYVEGKCARDDLRKYNEWLLLTKKFSEKI